ncbi:type II CRISPR RNA-guided endonuclease Cas9 [Luteolibacter algae]|uniref:Type II CRISPR RNA-guided endonuclease Cas9 n=1 Tax=Luteolibacter algae TaxID=454151 RepID=A0ABW5D7K2_9BACT
MYNKSITLSFDIGYASIGWCVLDTTTPAPKAPEILGTGVVTFPTDDCLASKRRDLRRTRRHIRSTRQRIERMKRWLQHRGVLSREDLDKPGHPAPFLLAAATLQGKKELSAWELWTVLRWYAHNRGYDGNSLWSRDEANDDDTEKETNAKNIMAKHGTSTMAETVCACLGLKVADHATRISSALPYKTLNSAYPRETVYQEVGKILCKHTGVVPGLDTETVRFLLKNSPLTREERDKLTSVGIKLPLRYHGGLLFGQLVPRFDNRIISRCPLTWAKTYDEAIAEGKDDKEARKLAEKFAKVPAAKSVEFLEYRFARIIANLRANGEPIAPELRLTLLNLAREQGRLTTKDLNRELKEYYGKAKTNISDYFTLHPDSTDALVLDPVAKLIHTKQILTPIWSLLSPETQEKLKDSWQKNKAISLAEIIHLSGKREKLEAALQPAFLKANKPKQGKTKYADFDQYLRKTTIAPDFPSGRAPYARPVLKQVLTEVLAGHDPTKAARKTSASEGETKEQDGILYPLNVKGSRVRTLEAERPLDQLTNNHLVRHRLLILDRLTEDIANEFLTDGREVSQIIIEVARELKEFSGKTAKEISSELNNRLKDFKSTISYLEKHAPDMELNGSLIRKARIAMDMGWKCPFTGEQYEPSSLKNLDRAHIIPFASRNTNALHALVLTRPEINSKQGKRTCLQFIMDEEENRKSGKSNLDLFTLKQYEAFVEKLDTKGHPDDARRKKARKALLLTKDMDDKDLGFTDGQLTQTSHLAKLAMRDLTKRFPSAAIDPIPGPVTAELRKAWDLTGTLSGVCPEVLDKDGKVKPKGEIRGLTHMHHGLDAATIAIAAHYFPFNKNGQDQKGKLWRALLKRSRTPEEQAFLQKTGLFKTYQKPAYDHEGTPKPARTELKLEDLPASLKQSLRLSLSQARVMQHLPADRSGAKAELTIWGVVSTEGEGDDARITLRQNATTVEEGRRKRDPKTREERAGKLLGPNPKGGRGKLAAIKGAMIIGENYGLALDPTPTVIPFHNVTARLAELRKANGGKSIRVLRNGMLVHLEKSPARSQQDYSGVWRIASIKNNKGKFLIDMIRPAYITPQNGVEWSGMNKNIGPLLECGLTILPRDYAARQDCS